MASRTFHERGESIDSVFPSFPSLITEIYNKHDAAELVEMMLSLFETIKKIKDIISNRYMENIIVARLSEEVYLSPNYVLTV